MPRRKRGAAVLDGVGDPGIRDLLVQHGARESLHRSRSVSCLGITPNGRRIVTLIADVTTRAGRSVVPERSSYRYVLRNLDSGKVEHSTSCPFGPVTGGNGNTLSFLPDGHTILVRSANGAMSRLDLLTGQSTPASGEWRGGYLRHVSGGSKVWMVRETPPANDPKATMSLVLQDSADGTTMLEVPLNDIYWLEINRDGTEAVTLTGARDPASGSYHDAVFHIIDLLTGKERAHTPSQQGFTSVQMGISSDGRVVAILLDGDNMGAKLTLWDAVTGRLRNTLPLPADLYLGPFAFSPDNSLLAYTLGQKKGPDRLLAQSSTVKVWDLKSAKPYSQCYIADIVTQLCFTPDSTKLIAASGEPQYMNITGSSLSPLHIVLARTGKQVAMYNPDEEGKGK